MWIFLSSQHQVLDNVDFIWVIETFMFGLQLVYHKKELNDCRHVVVPVVKIL